MMEKMSFVVFGVAPVICGLFLTLNYLIPIHQEINQYTITKLEIHSGRLFFKAAGFPCDDYPEICVVDLSEKRFPSTGDSVSIGISTGIFGYKVIHFVKLDP